MEDSSDDDYEELTEAQDIAKYHAIDLEETLNALSLMALSFAKKGIFYNKLYIDLNKNIFFLLLLYI